MTSSIIDKARDLVEVTMGLGRIGASLVAARVRAAAGIPTLRDCDACGGVAYELRTVDGETACIRCVESEREDWLRVARRAEKQAAAHERAFESARRRADKAERDLADLTRIHDDALTALSAAIQRAETAEAKCVKRVEQMLALKADLAVANARADKAEVERALLEAVVNALPTCAIHSGSLATSDKILVYPGGVAEHHRHCDACLGGEGDAPWAPALRALWAHHTEKGCDR